MRVPDPVGRAVATALAAGTAVRGARIFHPDGVAAAATLTVTPTRRWGCPLLDEPATYDALVRLSRGVGLAPWAPDLLGLAVHVPALDQDLLFVSAAGAAPVLRHLFAPLSTTYSTVLPFRAGEHTVVLGAHPDRPVRTYRTLAAAEGLVFRLLVAEPLSAWQEWGRLAVGARLAPHVSRELRFDPWRSGGGLVPVGWLQRLRIGAYRASQAARD